MENAKHQAPKPVDLGCASRRTLGAEGTYTDLVRMMEHWGIVRD